MRETTSGDHSHFTSGAGENEGNNCQLNGEVYNRCSSSR